MSSRVKRKWFRITLERREARCFVDGNTVKDKIVYQYFGEIHPGNYGLFSFHLLTPVLQSDNERATFMSVPLGSWTPHRRCCL